MSVARTTPKIAPRRHVLSVPWEERQTAQAAGATVDRELGCLVFDAEQLPPELLPYASKPYSWERWLEDDVNDGVEVAPPALHPQPRGNVVLRGHQRTGHDAVLRARDAGYPGFLVADETGLGKTLEAIQAARLMRATQVLVLCPLSAIPAWRMSIPELDYKGQLRWCLLNYESSKKLLEPPAKARRAKTQKTRNKYTARDGTSRVDWDLIICDESHRLGNPTSQQSSVVRRLAGEGVPGWHQPLVFRIWMSATAGQDPLRLSYLSSLLGAVTGQPVKKLDDFGSWCRDQGIAVTKGSYGNWGWEPANERDREHDLLRIKELLYDYPVPAAIRRHPEDIAGWPKQQRLPAPIEFGPEDQRLYNQAWMQFREEMNLARRGRNPTQGRTAQMRFRQKASMLKVPYVAQMTKDALSAGYQVAVSFEYLESVELFVREMNPEQVAIVTGQIKGVEREQQRLAFQRGQVKVVAFTVTESINLHAGDQMAGGNNIPRRSILADARWDGKALAQIEGRTHRDGAHSLSVIPYAVHTVDEKVVRMMIQRLSDMKTMSGDDTADVEAILQVLGI